MALYFDEVRRGRHVSSLRPLVNESLGGYVVAGLSFFGGDKLEVLVFTEDIYRVSEALMQTCVIRRLEYFKPFEGEGNRKRCLDRWRREDSREMAPLAVRDYFGKYVISLERDILAVDV